MCAWHIDYFREILTFNNSFVGESLINIENYDIIGAYGVYILFG
ncbi:hypothetical protein B1no1_28520 [Thermolongibacillus altinsuensis]|nr:hypothetical protein B1no1_28520 [Thermolongibacillus altinsuensis]